MTGFGVFFSFLGIIFFFDKGLIAMGNILFFSGVALTIGLKSSMQFFTKRTNFKGTMSFGAGFFLVVIGWPILGMILEAYGFIILFSGLLKKLFMQWVLANVGSFPAEDTYSWVVTSTPLCQIGMVFYILSLAVACADLFVKLMCKKFELVLPFLFYFLPF
nr:vesicle transport protein GOT1-like [Ipomoea batatas]